MTQCLPCRACTTTICDFSELETPIVSLADFTQLMMTTLRGQGPGQFFDSHSLLHRPPPQIAPALESYLLAMNASSGRNPDYSFIHEEYISRLSGGNAELMWHLASSS
uniref:Uncharacterized protein n=1 Tax=Tetranychus urticae TaxID=32264 RepID=T1K6D1_TETUR